jgi:NTP pyrophosphatase (non-canonical NTP hydrolase)
MNMEYKGQLFGKVGKSYLPLESTTEDFELLKNQICTLEEEKVKILNEYGYSSIAMITHLPEALRKYAEIEKELKRAEKKHPDWPENMFHQVAILNEESGEVTKAVNDYNGDNESLEHLKVELIQTAAMCMRMLKNLK